MDANGTRFHLLLGYDDWASCTDETGQITLGQYWQSSPFDGNTSGLEWDQTRMELTLQSRLFPGAQQDEALPLSQRRGADRDRYGNWYWIDSSGQELLVNSVGTGTTSHFWSARDGVTSEPPVRPGSFQPREVKAAPTALHLSGLVVTEDHYLVVGMLAPAGLLIFDLHAGHTPRQLLWPVEVPFAPFDMAAMPGCGIWILDREHARYWALDSFFHVISRGQIEQTLVPPTVDIFQAQEGSTVRRVAAQTFPTGITFDAALPLAVQDPIAIEALPDGTVLILDRNDGGDFSLVYRYRFAQPLGYAVSTESIVSLLDIDSPQTFQLLAYDFAFVPEHNDPDSNALVPDQLYIVGANGMQAYAFDIAQHNDQLALNPIAEYLPMRRFGGKALVATEALAYYDSADIWVPLLEQPRRRYQEVATLLTPLGNATLEEQENAPNQVPTRYAFDGREPDCTWHRLMLDACIPDGTLVQVWSRATNDLSELARVQWQPEPNPYQRFTGSELPFVKESSVYGTWELLFQHARGRFLQIKLQISGNDRSTPRLHAMRLYYPRFSYPEHYLPALYRDDDQSASFLERFLANIEGFYTNIEDKLTNIRILFMVASAPAEALEWLASWFGIALDPSWSEVKQRLFLKHAMDFFSYRGTIRGLRMALRLALEDCADETIFTDTTEDTLNQIRIVEKYLTRYASGVVYGDPTDLVGLRTVVVAQTARWTPQQGRAALVRRYADYIQQASGQNTLVVDFPLSMQDAWQQFDTLVLDSCTSSADKALWQAFIQSAWQQFSQEALGFVPSAPDNAYDQQVRQRRWQDFLAHRYHSLSVLNATYGLSASSFADIAPFTSLPSDGAFLQDWYQFESVVLAMYGTAHRFSVLLPTVAAEQQDALEQRRALAQRIIDLEKPAHTVFDVKFFWAYFRIGEARLGEDTLIDMGSRAPQLLPPMVLGHNYLSESYLAPGHPQNVPDRYVIGRGPLS